MSRKVLGQALYRLRMTLRRRGRLDDDLLLGRFLWG
jgi:hypothetical protein